MPRLSVFEPNPRGLAKYNMDWYLGIKVVHIISSTLLFGTGIGMAFFMFRSYASEHLHEKCYAANNTPLADLLFTLPAIVLRPLPGWPEGAATPGSPPGSLDICSLPACRPVPASTRHYG